MPSTVSSTRTSGSNTWPRRSAGIPGPLSATSTRQPPVARRAVTTTCGVRSGRVNLQALATRFCRSARSCVRVTGHDGKVAHLEDHVVEGRTQVVADLRHHRREVDVGAPQLAAHLPVGQQLLDQPPHPVRAAERPVDHPRRVAVPAHDVALLQQTEGHAHRRQRVAQVVGRVGGEAAQLLVGATQLVARAAQLVERPLELPGPQAELEHVDDAVREHPQRPALPLVEHPRLVVEDAERADRDTLRRDEVVGGVEPDVADHPGHEGVVREARVEAGVRDDHRLRLVQHRGAHGVLAGAHRRVEADGGDLHLLGRRDQVDHGPGYVADLRRERHQGLQVPAGRGTQDGVPGDPLDPCQVLMIGDPSRRHRAPSRDTCGGCEQRGFCQRPGAPHTGIHRPRSGSMRRSFLSRSRTWISSRLSRCCGPWGANG